jgi:hypothetical protein
MRVSRAWALWVSVLLVSLAGAAWADRGHMVIRTLQPDVSVRNAGQKAIIGWNGREEVLILSTDLSTAADAKVLEFLPLPSQPSEVVKAGPQAFSAVERIIAEHAPPSPSQRQRMGAGGRGGAEAPPVEIVYHQQIEAHDITIAKTEGLEAFLTWTRAFVKKQGGQVPSRGQDRLRQVVKSYLERGYHYFVFDVIDLGKQEKSVPPISYRFPSDHLFFPLVVSTLDTGDCNVQLFLFTPLWPKAAQLPPGLAFGQYRERAAGARAAEPIQFLLRSDDTRRVSTAMGELFAGRNVVFTAAKYRGPVRGLSRDLAISVHELGLDTSAPSIGLNPMKRPHLSPGGAYPSGLVWSPMGARLAVAATRPGPAMVSPVVVLELDAARMSATEVVSSGSISPYCWSPNGLSLCYVGGHERNVHVIEVLSRMDRQLTEFSDSEVVPVQWQPPAWAPSGAWLAFGAFGNLWVVRPTGDGLQRVTQFPESEPAGKGVPHSPYPSALPFSWLPDGKLLRYARHDDERDTWTWYTYDPETEQIAKVAAGKHTPGLAGALAAPNGGRAVYAQDLPTGHDAVWLITAGGEERAVFPDVVNASVSWLSDRTLRVRASFAGAPGLGTRLYDADTGETRTPEAGRSLMEENLYLVAPRPGTDEVAFALHGRLYLTDAKGGRWREVTYADSLQVRAGRDPAERWRTDPVVAAVRKQWEVIEAAQKRGDVALYNRVIFLDWHDLYASLSEQQRAAMEGGETLPYADLSPEQRVTMLRALAYRALLDRGSGAYPMDTSPPDWYWELERAHFRFYHQQDGGLTFDLMQPDQGNGMGIPLGRREDYVTGPAPAQGAAPRPVRHNSRLPLLGAAGAIAIAATGVWGLSRRGRRRA